MWAVFAHKARCGMLKDYLFNDLSPNIPSVMFVCVSVFIFLLSGGVAEGEELFQVAPTYFI